MTHERRNTTEKREALEALVSSPGWRLFVEQAMVYAGPENVVGDLLTAAAESKTVAELGALTASRLAQYTSMRFLVNLPGEMLSQLGDPA